MSGFRVSGGSLSIHHVLWKEAAVCALEKHSLDAKSEAATKGDAATKNL